MSNDVLNTQGGPERDQYARVLNSNGEPIPHLYSAGELGGICANQYRGDPLPPAVRGSDHEPGREAEFHHPLPVHQVCPGLHGRQGLHGGGDAGAEHHLRRCHRPALHHPPQHLGYRHVHAHCHRAAFEAAHCGRAGAGVRDGPYLPQRGHG